MDDIRFTAQRPHRLALVAAIVLALLLAVLLTGSGSGFSLAAAG